MHHCESNRTESTGNFKGTEELSQRAGALHFVHVFFEISKFGGKEAVKSPHRPPGRPHVATAQSSYVAGRIATRPGMTPTDGWPHHDANRDHRKQKQRREEHFTMHSQPPSRGG
jgi:hypothetical protein